MTTTSAAENLSRIHAALIAAVNAISPLIRDPGKAEEKSEGRGPVTEADRASNHALREILLHEGEGWLSEETVDDLVRLEKPRVWIVDPLDGTSYYVEGIPEWCVSVALVEQGHAVAGGICNPVTGEFFLGARGAGFTYNGRPAQASLKTELGGALVLASRSEMDRGEWERFRGGPFEIRAVGSVAYKLALVAAGLGDATWTLTPKNEWDVAAGVALVEAAGGVVGTPDHSPLNFNKESPALSGLYASGPNLSAEIASYLDDHR